MSTFVCDPGSDAESREAPKQLESTYMVGRWTYHSYRKSHDGKTLIVHNYDGFKVVSGDKVVEVKMDLRKHNPREFLFSPDNKFIAFWGPLEEGKPWKRIAVTPVGGISADPKLRYLYTPPPLHEPFGMEWAPDGKAMFVLENAVKEDGLNYGVLSRLDFPSGRKTELFRSLGKIDFFMPPVSRFESGHGISKKPYKLILGCENGLYLIEPKTGDKTRLSHVPAMGLHNLEWNPDEDLNQVMLFFRNPVVGADGRRYKGVYFVDLDKMEAMRQSGEAKLDDRSFMEQIHDQRNIHTLWFTDKGTYMVWASSEAIFFRRPKDPIEKTAIIEVLDEDGNPRKIKGVNFNTGEDKIVFSADGEVWVYDLDPEEEEKAKEKGKDEAEKGEGDDAKVESDAPQDPGVMSEEELIESITGKRPKKYRIAAFAKGFAAEPQWIGDRVVLTHFEEAKSEIRERRKVGNAKLAKPDVKRMESSTR